MLIKNYNYSENEISMMVVDTDGYLWVGFKQDSLGKCALQKVSANDLLQKYFDIDISTNEITRGFVSGTYVYLALNDSSLIGKRYSLLNPLTIYDNFSLPSGITEAPIDILVDSTYVYFLIPGSTSGTNTKICIFELSGTFSETIDLSTVTNAKSFTINTTTNELWVVTNTSPASYIRVNQLSGGSWVYTVNN